MEGDTGGIAPDNTLGYFNPLPPYGGRLAAPSEMFSHV